MDDNGTECGTQDPLDQIHSLYTELALRPDKEFGWGKGKGKGNARQLGFADDWLARLPDVVWESAAAVDNPFAVGLAHSGEAVVDMGCGAGAVKPAGFPLCKVKERVLLHFASEAYIEHTAGELHKC